MNGRMIFKKYAVFLSISVAFVSYIPKSIRIFIWDCCSRFSQLPFIAIRYVLLKSLIKDCGDNVRIGTNVQILNWEYLTIGNNVSIHSNSYLDASGGIIIKDNVSIAHNSTILSSNHSWDNLDMSIKYNPVELSLTLFGLVVAEF